MALRNRFKGLCVLGQGGFGKTYLAQDLDNRNKHCVIKRLTYRGPDVQSNEKARQLFEQEAERLDQLVHPQIPRLLAYFQEANYLYLVQEFIEGRTLHQEFEADGPFNEKKLRALMKGMLHVLQFVHSRNVIHRDIKPDNIMRRHNGELMLIDFGVAKFLEQSGFSHAATTIGTPGYAAPEQISGRVKPASDVFALGATCFQLLSGCFDTDEVSTIGYDWVKRWRQHVKLPISDELAAILSKMMMVDDTRRYQSATAVLDALLVGRPVHVQGLYAQAQGQSQSQVQGQASSQMPTAAISPNSPNITSAPPVVVAASGPSSAAATQNSASSMSAPFGVASSTSSSHFSEQTVISTKPNLDSRLSPPRSNSPLHSVKKVAVSAAFWLKYGLFTYTGHALGFLAAVTVTVALTWSTYANPLNPSSAEMIAFLELVSWMHWPVAGFFVGLAQWLAIRRWLPRSLWWLPATVAGFWAIAFAVAIGYADVFSGIVVGVFVGLPQWGAMRQQSPRAGWWLIWTMVFTSLLCQAISMGSLSVLGWFLIVPLLDGLFLSWILRRQNAMVKPLQGRIAGS